MSDAAATIIVLICAVGSMAVWLFLAYVFVSMWTAARQTAAACDELVKALRTAHADQRTQLQRIVVLAKADYLRARGFEEPDDEVEAAFQADAF